MTAPIELDGAKVLLYTDNKSSNDFGYVYYQEDEKTVVITALAVAQYEGSEGYYLFSCDQEWNVVGDTLHYSLQEAKDYATKSNASFIKWNATNGYANGER
ncbi:hypothetical protein ACFQI7_37010 [Paenibacillus allorhizosphaerae]|uniref:DUF2251 domain-containing protein n=1 Tax=Paenibacillus allorhizosphaerae TaxID=2849866 RepID=A0ABM8VTX4_9BACL|nr:hypothetical protein [Paenibacillus allorhizosphaerae]CAG7658302.1 hypothetical protein PAECIP111802_07012 [Paenibacillus allorhizosphaerae]